MYPVDDLPESTNYKKFALTEAEATNIEPTPSFDDIFLPELEAIEKTDNFIQPSVLFKDSYYDCGRSESLEPSQLNYCVK